MCYTQYCLAIWVANVLHWHCSFHLIQLLWYIHKKEWARNDAPLLGIEKVTFISTNKLKYTQVTLVLLHINSCTQISCFWNKWLITETLVFVWNYVISNEQFSTEIKAWLSIKPFCLCLIVFWMKVQFVVECFVQRTCDFLFMA